MVVNYYAAPVIVIIHRILYISKYPIIQKKASQASQDNQGTLYFQVILLWRRAIDDPGFKRIFCIAHAEKLSYVASEECTRKLMMLKQGKHGNHTRGINYASLFIMQVTDLLSFAVKKKTGTVAWLKTYMLF